ncbi:general substrate transporter [Hesseltinella vesiculosa]|uniref:General substrate transporter n=1 Tax=Hesseltinella vesiculosa TaxID=101127 RepID=A0A1X2G3G7_9FUNG|nr:general substrate transporter [Hesseltinella vesiculosa]
MADAKLQVDKQRRYSATDSELSDGLINTPLPKFRKSVYIAAAVAAFGGMLCGYDTGCISGILIMPYFDARFFTADNMVYLQGLLVAFYLMTAALGAFFSGYFCDRFSRKWSIVGATVVFCIGVLLQTIGYNFGMVCAGRLITGFGAGLMGNGIPLYHSEISPPDVRGRLISLFTFMSTTGQVVGYFVTFGTTYVDSDWSWRGPWLIQLMFGIVFGVFVSFLGYSPRWLIDHGRKEEALKTLAQLNELPENHVLVHNEFKAIVDELEFEQSLGKRTYKELFVGTNLRRTMLAFFISISTAFTGSDAIWYYAPQILQNAGLTDLSSSIAASGGSGLLSMLATFISMQFIIDRYGRKPVFIVGAAVMGLAMFVVGGMFAGYAQIDPNTGTVIVNDTNARNTIIAFVYVFTATFAATYGLASYVYPAEVFNMRCRAKGLALTFGLNWGFSILITYCVPLFMATTVSGVFFFFGACCVVCCIGDFFIPELKGLSLESVEELFAPKQSIQA